MRAVSFSLEINIVHDFYVSFFTQSERRNNSERTSIETQLDRRQKNKSAPICSCSVPSSRI